APEQPRNRGEWSGGYPRRHMGRPLPAEGPPELKPLNRLLERDEIFERIAPRPAGRLPFELEAMRRWRHPDALLLPVGQALARLVSTEDFAHVKACEGATCTLLFADHTRAHLRRGGSMGACRNRAKPATP